MQSFLQLYIGLNNSVGRAIGLLSEGSGFYPSIFVGSFLHRCDFGMCVFAQVHFCRCLFAQVHFFVVSFFEGCVFCRCVFAQVCFCTGAF